MLRITIPAVEQWDEETGIRYHKVDIAWSIPSSLFQNGNPNGATFLTKQEKTFETLDYIKCMTPTQNVIRGYNYLTNENTIEEINKVSETPMTATYFSDEKNSNSREQVMKLIYYWLIN